MYYHTQEMKYVQYGKIYPPPIEVIDDFLIKPYQWLGKYCKFMPQIWLSRSKLGMTGYKSQTKRKGGKYFGTRKNFEPNVMFGFDIIKGFPVDFEIWCFCLNPLMNCKDPIREGDDAIKRSFDEWYKDCKEDPDIGVDNFKPNGELYKWSHSRDFQDFLNRYMFVENDQVVVPSLNLKAAKQIFCRNEKQVKALRHMGFIHDRIKILNSKQWD